MLSLAAVYTVTLVPGIGPDGWSPAIDGWLNMSVCALIIVVLVQRTLLDRGDRAAWLCMIAGLVAAFSASTAYLAYYQYVDPVRIFSWSDVGYLLFYLLLAIGLVLRLRSRARHLPFSLSLDGLIAGLTTAALAETYVPGAEVPLGAGHIVSPEAAYPVADLLLLALAVAAVATLGTGAGWSWCLLCASFVTFFLTDAVYAAGMANGTYVGGGPIDVGWLLARLLMVAAALVSLRARESRTVDLEGASVLVLPGVCGLAVLGLLYDGIRPVISPFAAVVALSAGVLIVGRTALTFQELRELTRTRERALSERLVEAQDDERARIAADVHDDSVQALAAVDLRLGALRNRLRARVPDEAAGVDAVIDAVHGAGVRLRHLLFELETPVLDAELSDGLRDAAAHVFDDCDTRWSVEERTREPLPEQVRVSAYRIAREALVNVRKHAQATSVRVTVDATARGVEVHVEDDGRGVAAASTTPSRRRHSGVVAMRDRALATGGWWRSGPGDGGVGTSVSFFLPVAGAGSPAALPAPGALPREQPPDDARRAGNGDHQVPLHAPAQQGGQITGDAPFEQVGRSAGGQHPGPRGGVRLR
jgi:signal transduction histidine kinase